MDDVMDPGSIHLVVAGFDQLGDALEATGLFAAVHRVGSTSQLRDLIQSKTLPGDRERVVFAFADDVVVDTPQDLSYLIGRLSTGGWKTVIIGVTPRGRDLSERHPSAGLVEVPVTVNVVLGALAGLGVGPFDPVEGWGYEEVTRDRPAPAGPAGHAAPAATGPAAPDGSGPRGPEGFKRPGSRPDADAGSAPAAGPGIGDWKAPGTGFRPVGGGRDGGAEAGGWTKPSGGFQPLRPAQDDGPGGFTPVRERAADGPRPRTDADGIRFAPLQSGLHSPGGYEDFSPRGGLIPRERSRVIAVTSPKGGTGKSTLTVNLGVYLGLRLRRSGKKVCVVDANFQQADAGKILGDWTPNITDVLRNASEALHPARITDYLVHRPRYNTSFLLGPPIPKDASPAFFTAEFYTKVVNVLRQVYDYILIDTPVAELYHDTFSGFVIPQADYILVVATPVIHTLLNVKAWIETVTAPSHVTGSPSVDPERIGVVLNQAQEGIDCDVDDVRRALAQWKMVGVVPATKEWLRANNRLELVATKNYIEINRAFSEILYAVTGEEALLHAADAQDGTPQDKGGLLSRILKAVRG